MCRDKSTEEHPVAFAITDGIEIGIEAATHKSSTLRVNSRQFGLQLQLQRQAHSGSTALFPTRNYRHTARGHSSARLLLLTDVKAPLLGYTHVADRAGLQWCRTDTDYTSWC